MKKIIFVINNLQIGGVQISLLNLLKEIHNDYDVTVLSFYCKEEYRKLIPDNVHLIGVKSPFRYLGISQGELRGKPAQYVARAFFATLTRVFGRSFTIKIMSLFQRTIGPYDCAISFLHEGAQKSFYGGCNEFLLKKVKADKKIAWLHCDFEKCGANNSHSHKIYQQFDSIVACSEGCRQSFLKCLPGFENKTITIRNCNDYERIWKLAKDGISYDDKYFNIVTVARLSQEKGIERAIRAIETCLNCEFNVRYHIVGSGIMESGLKDIVSEKKMTENVLFYGNQPNPYKYIKGADLFLLPSYHEAAPMVFDEAASLGVPVLATDTTSTEEMILQNNSGFVCENSQEGITNFILKIVSNPQILDGVRRSLVKRNFSNCDIKRVFSSVINNNKL